MEKNRIDIQINGKSYVLTGYESEEHMYKVGKVVDRMVGEVSSKFPTMSTTDVAMLVALNLAEQLVTLKDGKTVKVDPIPQPISAPVTAKADAREALLPKLPQLTR